KSSKKGKRGKKSFLPLLPFLLLLLPYCSLQRSLKVQSCLGVDATLRAVAGAERVSLSDLASGREPSSRSTRSVRLAQTAPSHNSPRREIAHAHAFCSISPMGVSGLFIPGLR